MPITPSLHLEPVSDDEFAIIDKAVARMTGEHDAQSLHYSMLQDIRLVKLINFGEQRVQGKLLRNALCNADRHCPRLRDSNMRFVSPNCERLVAHLKAIIHDWGTHLSNQLYSEALVDFFGGEAHSVQRMELRSGPLFLGTHRVQFHADGLAFVVTSLSRDQTAYRKHLEVLLTHTTLKGITFCLVTRKKISFA